MKTRSLGDGWKRSYAIADDIRQRAKRCGSALAAAGVDYATAGGIAVAEWVESRDEGAARNTRDVNILIERVQLTAAQNALLSHGFVASERPNGEVAYGDGVFPDPKFGVRFLFCEEKTSSRQLIPNPDLNFVTGPQQFRLLDLKELVRMKLSVYRLIDKVHLHDLIDVGLIDSTWPAKFPSPLAERLQHILDTPDG